MSRVVRWLRSFGKDDALSPGYHIGNTQFEG